MSEEWAHLLSVAEEEVRSTLRGLPEDLRDQASQVPVVFEEAPSEELRETGIESETLGLFLGDACHDVGMSCIPTPNCILLFLANIWLEAGADEAEYRVEVRKTLLHELGHYLGLNEEDLEGRGLG